MWAQLKIKNLSQLKETAPKRCTTQLTQNSNNEQQYNSAPPLEIREKESKYKLFLLVNILHVFFLIAYTFSLLCIQEFY